MVENRPLLEFPVDYKSHPLHRSRIAVYVLLLGCILMFSMSCMTFLYQVAYTDEFGELYRDQPGSWSHLFGHILRGLVAACLALRLWAYLSAVRNTFDVDTCQSADLFHAIESWWNSLAASGIAIVLYAVWSVFVADSPAPYRPVSPRFHAEDLVQPAVSVEFRLAETDPADGLTEVAVYGSSRSIFLHEEPIVTNRDIVEARVVVDDSQEPAVEVKFSPAAKQRIGDSTEAHRGKPLAILVDGRVVAAPVVQWRISEAGVIHGGFSLEEAERIAKCLAGKK